jgi:hypothetical protein
MRFFARYDLVPVVQPGGDCKQDRSTRFPGLVPCHRAPVNRRSPGASRGCGTVCQNSRQSLPKVRKPSRQRLECVRFSAALVGERLLARRCSLPLLCSRPHPPPREGDAPAEP